MVEIEAWALKIENRNFDDLALRTLAPLCDLLPVIWDILPGYLLLATGCGFACAPKASLRGLSIESDLEAGRAAGAARFDHGAWGRVLAAAAEPERGRFDYDAVPRPDLDAYLLQLERAPLATLPGDEQRALLINAYNAFTVQLIVSQPVRPASIRDLPSPWKTAQWTLGGHALSLDDIEHGLLRPVFRDPRVHFAVNCASVGCPPLWGAPFEAAALDAQLAGSPDDPQGDLAPVRDQNAGEHGEERDEETKRRRDEVGRRRERLRDEETEE